MSDNSQDPIISVCVDFCNRFSPCSEEEADEIFTIGRLRDEFSAWPPPFPDAIDPLPLYIQTLEKNGFSVRQTYSSGPAITCKYKVKDENVQTDRTES